MPKNRALPVFTLLATVALAPAALAAVESPTTGTPYVFETVDEYNIINSGYVEVAGILQGESTPRTFRFYFGSGSASIDPSQHLARCDRMALLAMSRPGRYLLEMAQGGGLSGSYARCKLIRR